MSEPSSPGPGPLLAVTGLTCRRGELTLFEGLDFEVEPGRIVWVRGANGQGKTTLLRTIAGLARADAGRIVMGGAAAMPPLYIGHANALKDDLDVFDSLRFLLRLGAGAADVPSDVTVLAALARFGLAGRRRVPVRTLSQGQRRRVALARLAAPMRATLWLLDEPFDALDAAGSETLIALLAEHTGRGGGVVLTSHAALALDPEPVVVTLAAPGPAPGPAP